MEGKLITFEGIDGVGKTTISKKVADKLKKQGMSVIYINKKDINIYESDYVRSHMKTIKTVLWDYNPEEKLFDLGDNHWLYLNLTWFSTLYDYAIKKELSKGNLVITDGWYYKLYSRFVIKEKYNQNVLNDIFFNVPEPDLVYYLNADFSTILSRRTEFLPTEFGEMDANKKLLTDKADKFIDYQTRVKRILDSLSDQKGWDVFLNEQLEDCVNSITANILTKF
ncbi:dTMP kinase [Streptococcus orisasini]